MPSTVNTSFLSKVVNKLLSFNLAPESFHIPDIFYPLLFIHSGEHRFTLDFRNVYVHFCFLTKNSSSRTCPWSPKFFTSPVTIILKSFLISGNSLHFAFDSITRIFRFSGFFNHACFFSGYCKRPFIVLSKFLNPKEPRYPFCHFSWWWLWRRSWLCSEENEQFDHPCWFAQAWLCKRKVSVGANSNYLLQA